MKKVLGQHFLINQEVIAQLVSSGEITNNTIVLEVGPGKGAVTEELAKQAAKVIAVEFDQELIPFLKKKFDGTNVEIIAGDILKITRLTQSPLTIVSSLPYQITSPFLHRLVLGELGEIEKLSLLVQKEVADKITAKPPKASYLANFVLLYGVAKYLQTIPPQAFNPPPKVESALITIKKDPAKIENKIKFMNFLHKGFSHPRKMLKKVFALELLNSCGIDPRRRAETLTFEEWCKLFSKDE